MVKSADRTLEILEALAEAPHRPGLSELAQQLGIPKSSLHAILRTMTALSAFAAIFAATGGGPGTSTEILNLYAYRTSFTELNIGYGSAQAMVLLAITLFVSWLLFRRRKGHA